MKAVTPILLFILTKTKAGIESQQEHCCTEKSHDPRACWVVAKGLEIQIPLETARHRRCRIKLKGPVEKPEIQEKVGKTSHTAWRTGYGRQRKENTWAKSCKESSKRDGEHGGRLQS